MATSLAEPLLDQRDRQPDEMTVAEVAALWGLKRGRTWQLITMENVVPYRKTFYAIYVKRHDALRHDHAKWVQERRARRRMS